MVAEGAMVSRSLTQLRPDAGQIGPGAGQGGMTPTRIGKLRPRETGADTLATPGAGFVR